LDLNRESAASGGSGGVVYFKLKHLEHLLLQATPHTCERHLISDDGPRRPADDLERVWADLRDQGYALTSDVAIGVPEKCRQNLSQSYYNSETLHHDPGDIPVDRERARDVIRYMWKNDDLELEAYDQITLTNRAGISGQRDHSRVHLLKDPEAEELIRRLLELMPPRQRQPEGTFGINLFRTYTNVVTTPHHDHEEFVILYVIDRIGNGAESYLYRPEDVAEDGRELAGPILKQQLDPGDIFIFEDRRFKHGATPLIDPPGGSARRDAFVCTFDYFGTYLGQASGN
jgi:hypothetical protein